MVLGYPQHPLAPKASAPYLCILIAGLSLLLVFGGCKISNKKDGDTLVDITFVYGSMMTDSRWTGFQELAEGKYKADLRLIKLEPHVTTYPGVPPSPSVYFGANCTEFQSAQCGTSEGNMLWNYAHILRNKNGYTDPHAYRYLLLHVTPHRVVLNEHTVGETTFQPEGEGYDSTYLYDCSYIYNNELSDRVHTWGYTSGDNETFFLKALLAYTEVHEIGHQLYPSMDHPNYSDTNDPVNAHHVLFVPNSERCIMKIPSAADINDYTNYHFCDKTTGNPSYWESCKGNIRFQLGVWNR